MYTELISIKKLIKQNPNFLMTHQKEKEKENRNCCSFQIKFTAFISVGSASICLLDFLPWRRKLCSKQRTFYLPFFA